MEKNEPRVVVGYDGSDAARAALDWAIDEAQRRGAALSVVYGVDFGALVGGPIGTSPSLPIVALEAAHDVANEGVERAQRRAGEVRATPVTQPGRAIALLVDASRSADLVVVGTRGHGTAASALLGSTAVTVAGHAHCPVVVVTGEAVERPGPRHPVVVGADGSPASTAAVRYAAGVAAAAGAPLTVVCAWQRPDEDHWSRAYWFAIDPQADPDAAAERAARGVGEAAVAVARETAPGVATELRVPDAGPVAGILGEARHAGMVVVGARGRGAVAGLLLGSVSQRVMHRAPCPVTVVRAEHAAATTSPEPAAAHASS